MACFVQNWYYNYFYYLFKLVSSYIKQFGLCRIGVLAPKQRLIFGLIYFWFFSTSVFANVVTIDQLALLLVLGIAAHTLMECRWEVHLLFLRGTISQGLLTADFASLPRSKTLIFIDWLWKDRRHELAWWHTDVWKLVAGI